MFQRAYELYCARREGYAEWQISDNPYFSFATALQAAWERRMEEKKRNDILSKLTPEQKDRLERLKQARSDLDYLPSGMSTSKRRDKINEEIYDILGFID